MGGRRYCLKDYLSSRPAKLLNLLLFTVAVLAVYPAEGLAQNPWTTSGSNIFNSNTGNVGINNHNPLSTLHLVATVNPGFFFDAYKSTSTPYPNFRFQLAEGTPSSPSYVMLGDTLGDVGFGGYAGGSSAGFTVGASAIVVSYASENWSGAPGTGQGADLSFWTTPTGSPNSAHAQRMIIDPFGNVGINTNTPASLLDVNGAATIRGATAITGAATISGTLSSGSLSVTGNITATGTVKATYQDVAEWVPAAEPLTSGTVVVLNPDHSNQVMASKAAYDTTVAGVISARPGVALGEEGEGKSLVATTGRVRVRVDASASPIRVGDLLVTSDKPGLAMKSVPVEIGGVKMHRPGTLIGKALEPLATGTGEILVLLSLQ